MGLTVAEKIIKKHLAGGELAKGKPISIHIDQTLTQDATGTMAYLQFEAMEINRVKTDLSVSYVDHNSQIDNPLNVDAHNYLKSVAAKYGINFSPTGNGICHQVHLERFGKPGTTLLGSDSHTPTGGGIGQIAIGAGGLDVACAMAGKAFDLIMPEIINIKLIGQLNSYVTAKDIILKVLQILTVKGGVGKIIEYSGPGIKTLSVPERATITNMGAELGATTSVFPSDEITKEFLFKEKREEDWQEIIADDNADYEQTIEIDLSKLEPLVAKPHMPDLVEKVKDINDLKVDQVLIGSCTNSSYKDIMIVADMLEGKKVAPNITFAVSPGSKQVLDMVTKNGALQKIKEAGAKILDSVCGFCIGVEMEPKQGGISVRTNNRNFKGRSGTPDASIYLVSPETAVATALTGKLTDPTTLGLPEINFQFPKEFLIDDREILKPAKKGNKVEIERGKNIKPCPKKEPLTEPIYGEILLKTGDNITTDDIMPAGAKILPLRSNVPEISKYVFSGIDKDFYSRALEKKGGFIIGGENYGQGSSREHAALAPMYLGVTAIIAKSFARIHKANLINFGILPLTFTNQNDYDEIQQGQVIELENVVNCLTKGNNIETKIDSKKIILEYDLSEKDKEILIAGGMLNFVKK